MTPNTAPSTHTVEVGFDLLSGSEGALWIEIGQPGCVRYLDGVELDAYGIPLDRADVEAEHGPLGLTGRVQ